ncbi:hypothetical protein [Claveliimonas bilis]|uniref:hypothetical protein n=1 Tax=Clostridia TaxID=186801 RepID=UPI00210DCD8E|nr:hypothetical protein [Claveliimonas bilis]MCQ5203821.1 hypothetical protein [Mordavella massiliensis]BDZ84460.1 hypothetical protein Lac2_25940 [Claveliimonas bilis]
MIDSDRISEGLEKESRAAGDCPVYDPLPIEDEKIRPECRHDFSEEQKERLAAYFRALKQIRRK